MGGREDSSPPDDCLIERNEHNTATRIISPLRVHCYVPWSTSEETRAAPVPTKSISGPVTHCRIPSKSRHTRQSPPKTSRRSNIRRSRATKSPCSAWG
mmetsp:Transcript_61676/g.74199  ORF Transcript_61676/g.74199 Transcript_61676/m.74199 type:complete len:98 (+) Transcript_61676:235-528(+)